MFENREEAGLKLSALLLKENYTDAIVICIPRGGVIVGKVIAKVLKIPLTILIVKKIGAPNNPELAIGATGSENAGGIVFWDENLVENFGISQKEKETLLKKTFETISELEKKFKVTLPNIENKFAIVVDDGVATGATAIASSLIVKKLGAKKIILATSVISRSTKVELKEYFDKIIAAEIPPNFKSVGQFYNNFPQVENAEVNRILNQSVNK